MTMTSPRISDTYAWQKRWRVERDRGLKRTTGPERAQAHVQGLIKHHGVTSRAISEAANISRTLLNHLERGVCTGLLVTSEAKILAVRPHHVLDRANPSALVPNIGTRRRLEALLAIGWRHDDLKPRLGFDSRTVLTRDRTWVTSRKHEAACRAYDVLWNQPGPSDEVRRRSAKLGYVPPLAWDDDSIDDPNARPDLGARVYAQGRCPEGVIHKSDATVEDVEFLLEEGLNWDTVTARLAMNPESLERLLLRKGRSDLITRARTMAERRAYARAS